MEQTQRQVSSRHRVMSHSDSNANREVVYHYCGKSGHITRVCFKKINKYSNNRYRKHNGNYVRKDTLDVSGFKNLRLFISEHALSAKRDDEKCMVYRFECFFPYVL